MKKLQKMKKDKKTKVVHCERCGRPLTAEKSVERGFGPVCWRKIHKKYGSTRRWRMTQNPKEYCKTLPNLLGENVNERN